MADHTPASVKAAVLRAAARTTYGTTALPTIAHNHQLTLDDVKTIVEKHGWPRKESMLRAAEILERRQAEQVLEADLEQHDDVLVQVPVGKVHPDPNNVREQLGDLTELADSIVQVGLIQPIVVRRHSGRLVVVSGHRRLAAVRQLHHATVACVIRSHVDPDEVLAAMLAENGQRLGLDPIEEARALALLKERHDLSDLEVARRVSRSQPYVSGRLALLSLPPEQQAEIRAGLMTLSDGSRRGRKQGGFHRPAAQGKKSAAHLDQHHRLADLVTKLCRERGHHKHTPGRIGGVGCGHCWEDTIRADERRQIEQQRS